MKKKEKKGLFRHASGAVEAKIVIFAGYSWWVNPKVQLGIYVMDGAIYVEIGPIELWIGVSRD